MLDGNKGAINIKTNVKKSLILLVGILLTLLGLKIFFSPVESETKVTLIADGNKNVLSNGSEVWLTGIEINGQNVDLEKYDVEGKWKKIDGNIVFVDDSLSENKSLELNFPNASEVSLVFAGHAWSGILEIKDGDTYTTLDLYNSVGEIRYQVENLSHLDFSFTKLLSSCLLLIICAYLNIQLCLRYLSNGKRQKVILVIFHLFIIGTILKIFSMKHCIAIVLLLLLLYRIMVYESGIHEKKQKELIFLWGGVLAGWLYYILYLHKPTLVEPQVIYAVIWGGNLLWIGRWGKEKRWTKVFISASSPILCFLMIEIVSNVSPERLTIGASILNIILLSIFNIILVNLFDVKKLGWYLMHIGSFCISLINHYVIQFKKFALLPSDLLQFNTALTVAGDYKYDLTKEIIIGLILLIFAIILVHIYIPNSKFSLKRSIQKKGIAIGAIIVFTLWIKGVDFAQEYSIVRDNWDTSQTYSEYGFTLSFLSEMQHMNPDKPEGYSREKAEQILNRYSEVQSSIPEEKPTIIAIMNESFSDLSALGDLRNTENVMSYIESSEGFLETGKTYMSVRGGETCNSEFEFLTGNSMNFFGNAYPYTQYDFANVSTFVKNLKNQGYRTVAMHPADPTNYKRETVYPQIGFDEFYSFDDFKDYEKIFLDRISDYDNYRKLIDIFDSTDEPLFIFNVTIQNHGDYNIETLNPKYPLVDIDSKYSEYKDVQMYLTLMKESNKALEYLFDYFEKESKPVIICFFGDHQPGCLNPDFESDFIKDDKELSELFNSQKYFQTPYFFWSNFDIDSELVLREKDSITSANYLSGKLLEYAKLPQTKYEKFLKEMSEYIVAINKFGYLGNNGMWYGYHEDSPYLQWIDEYKILQYYNMFEQSE